MNLAILFKVVQLFFLFYFIAINLVYFLLNVVALITILKHRKKKNIDNFPDSAVGFEFPISVLVPAHNEETTVVETIRSLFQLTYPTFEILVINDGSQDKTLQVLIEEFSLSLFPESIPDYLSSQPIRGVYRSKKYPNLRVIDKENGGKADSLNAGVNLSRYPLFCCMDADSILQRNSLQLVSAPFIEDSRTIATGGIVRIINGCEVKQGYLIKSGLPSSWLVLLQIVEYLRAFLFGRLGWSPLNGMLVISGAFGVFKKEAVLLAGGYCVNTVGEDMELVVRLHRIFTSSRKPYRISYVPDPICWTEAPSNLKVLGMQRIRWQQGVAESLTKNFSLLFHPRGKAVSWLAFPYMILFEWLGPIIEVVGYLFVVFAYFIGFLSLQYMGVFFLVSIGMGLFLSTSTLVFEELSYQIYPRQKDLIILLGAAIFENLGYRQLNSFWRLRGILRWLFGKKGQWGEMTRSGNWNQSK